LIASTGFAVVRPRPEEFDARYCKYALREPAFLAEVEKRSVGVSYPAINASDLASIPVHVHPLPQQRAIADYLDRETARLDALVAAKERLLGILAEKRRAFITRAVTRGLDPATKMRDSGISWLGEIPTHWEIWRLGHLARVGNGSTPRRDNPEYWTDGSIPWLNSSVVNQNEVTASDQFVTQTAFRECHLPLVRPGSVLVGITGQGKTRGQAVVLSLEATVNQHIAYVTPRAELLAAWFLRWTLLAAYDFLRSISDDAGGTKGALTCEAVAELRVPVPPIEEQQAIVVHISRGTAKFDAMHSATERTIALLRERRSALIAAAVTGQIDVWSAT
jgi:type I restriction enzyme S subunit